MWIIQGAWIFVIISVLFAWGQQGEVGAANKAAIGAAFLLIVHISYWLYQRAKSGTKEILNNRKKNASIDDTIYDQVAAELSINQIHAGLMARAIAEADGDKDKTQAIYIKLRVAAIAAEQAKAKQPETDRQDDIKDSFFDDAIKRGEQEKTAADKEVWANQIKAEHIAKYEKNKNQVHDRMLVRTLSVLLFVMLFGLAVYSSLNPAESLSSSAQQPSPTIQKEFERLAQVHPDFDKIAKDPAFQEWIKNQPDSLKKLYASTSAEDNIVLLNIYKNTTNN